MGIYFNTGIQKFNSALKSKIYIDKTVLLSYTNSVLDTEDRYLCLSRPRRFGKSITAAMLSAYYGKGFDSSTLFDDKKIAQSADYRDYMNHYDIIEVDMNVFRNCSEITHDNYLSKCSSAASENLDIARYACDFLLCS